MSTLRTKLALGGVLLITAGGLGLTSMAQGDSSLPANLEPAAVEAVELAAEPDVAAQDYDTQYRAGTQSAARAAAVQGDVPLPDGEAFNDIQWAAAPLSEGDIQELLEYNSACKWWIEHTDAPTTETAQVVSAIPEWPTMREGDRHTTALAVATGAPDAELYVSACRAELQ